MGPSSWAQGVQSQMQMGGAAGLGLNFDPGVSGLGALGVPSGLVMGGINAGVITGADAKPMLNPLPALQALQPLKPNAFQSYLLQTTGQPLKLFGSEFFDNSSSAQASQPSPFVPLVSAPASPEYALGAGDQLLVRAWGSVNINYQATIDRNGLIALPKVGAISLGGVKLSKAEGVIEQAISKYYKNFELNVTLGQTRTISVYVVGQARRSGSYALSSLSTLSTAIFASGGPSGNGSMRKVQLKRNNVVISEFDVYEFLSRGQVDNDVKLLDGDVIVYPNLFAQVALIGSVNTPAVYEIKSDKDPIPDLLKLAGGLSLLADPEQVTLERFSAEDKQSRAILNLNLKTSAQDVFLRDGDVIHFYPKRPETQNAVTLRGAVTQAKKVPWREGMKISDLIPNKAFLLSADSVRRQNEVLFDANQRERALRSREQIPSDLLLDKGKLGSDDQEIYARGLSSNNKTQSAGIEESRIPTGQAVGLGGSLTLEAWQSQRDKRLFAQQPKIDENKAKSLIEQVGQLLEAINLDYAVVERINAKDLSVEVIPFDLGSAIAEPGSPNNLELKAGDVVTIFKSEDMQVPITKRQIIVRIEGEVNRPGVYQMKSSETLKELLDRAGGVTREAYLYGAGLYRDEIKKTQTENLDKLLRRLESESAASLAQLSQSMGASSDASIMQARLLAGQQAQKQSIERFKNLKPDGRIALGLEPSESGMVSKLPSLKLRNNDLFKVPSKPDFVYVYGAVNTDSALIYRQEWNTQDYLNLAGTASSADKDALILIRADGTAVTNNSVWSNKTLSAKIYPGDTIIVPEKIDRESAWSSIFRNTKDMTQIFYNLGLGAAAIRTLRN